MSLKNQVSSGNYVNSSTARPYTIFLSTINNEQLSETNHQCVVNLIPPIAEESVGAIFEVALKSFTYSNSAIQITSINNELSFSLDYLIQKEGGVDDIKKNISIKINEGAYTPDALVAALNSAVDDMNAALVYELYTPNVYCLLDMDDEADLQFLTDYLVESGAGNDDYIEDSLDIIREELLNSFPVFGSNKFSYDPTNLLDRYYFKKTQRNYAYDDNTVEQLYLRDTFTWNRESNHIDVHIQSKVQGITTPKQYSNLATRLQTYKLSMKTAPRGILNTLRNYTEYNNTSAFNTELIGVKEGYAINMKTDFMVTDRTIGLMRILGFVKGSELLQKSTVSNRSAISYTMQDIDASGHLYFNPRYEFSGRYTSEKKNEFLILTPFSMRRSNTEFLDIFCRDMKTTMYSSVSKTGLTKGNLLCRVPYSHVSDNNLSEVITFEPKIISSFYHKGDIINKLQIDIYDDFGRPFNFFYKDWFLEILIQSKVDMGDILSNNSGMNTITPTPLSTYIENKSSTYDKMRKKRNQSVHNQEAEKVLKKVSGRPPKHKKKNTIGTLGGTSYEAETGSYSLMGDSYDDSGLYEGENYDIEGAGEIDELGNLDAVEEMRQYVEKGIKKQKRQFV